MTSNETAEAINIAKIITSTISSFRNLVSRAWLSWSPHYRSTSIAVWKWQQAVDSFTASAWTQRDLHCDSSPSRPDTWFQNGLPIAIDVWQSQSHRSATHKSCCLRWHRAETKAIGLRNIAALLFPFLLRLLWTPCHQWGTWCAKHFEIEMKDERMYFQWRRFSLDKHCHDSDNPRC